MNYFAYNYLLYAKHNSICYTYITQFNSQLFYKVLFLSLFYNETGTQSDSFPNNTQLEIMKKEIIRIQIQPVYLWTQPSEPPHHAVKLMHLSRLSNVIMWYLSALPFSFYFCYATYSNNILKFPI